ncbi:MAG: 3-isopropylmalate dehydratase [Alphaproteobacteria bacterium]
MGRLWKFDDTIDTDILAPGFYMKSPLPELASHCLEALRPEFAASVQPGDVLMAGANMGVGSSREQAAEVLKHLGIAAVIAPSFAGIFYRNAINLGLPVLVIPEAELNRPEWVDGASVSFDFDQASLTFDEDHTVVALEPLPDFLRALILDGGLVGHLEKRFADPSHNEVPQ